MAGVTWRCWTIVSLLILIASYADCYVSLQANNQSQEYNYTFSRFNTSSINETQTIIITATDDLIQLKVSSSEKLSDQACAEGPIQIYTGQARLFHGSYCGGEKEYFSSSHPVLVIVVNTTSLPDNIEINFLYKNNGFAAEMTSSWRPRFLYTSNYPNGGSLYDLNFWRIRAYSDASTSSAKFFTMKYADVNYKPDCALSNVSLLGDPPWCGQEANTFWNTYTNVYLFSLGQKLLQSGLQIIIWTDEVKQCKQEIATTETENITVIQSPGFPNGYSQYTNCRWYANYRRKYRYYLVKADVVDIDCQYDALEISYLSDTSSKMLRKRIECENEPLVMEYYTDYLRVWFISTPQRNPSNHTGFSITVQLLNDTSCYTELVATDSVQKLSPNVTAPSHGICKWVFRVSNPVMVVKIRIKNYHPWCRNRQNRIYDGLTEDRNSAMNDVCGNGFYQSTSGSLKIVMTNMAGTFGGEITFWQGKYSRYLTDVNAIVTYPFEQGNYKSGVDVTWIINFRPSKRITLFFSQMDVNCGGDAVYIHDGLKSWSICGSHDRSFLSQTHSLTINFKSTTGQGTGFRFRYYDTNVQECGDSVIDVNRNRCSFKSPGYNYFDNLFCKWRIISSVSQRIKLTITVKEIKTTSHTACEGDYLQVYDGYSETSRTLARVCGVNKVVTLESSGNEMYVEFITNSVLTGTGFEARCSTIKAGESGLSTGIIVGIVAALIFVLMVGCLVFCCTRSSRRRERGHTQTATPFSESQTQTVSPPFSESQTQTVSPPPSYDELSPSSHNDLTTPPPTYDDVVKKPADFQLNSPTVTSSL